MDVTEEVEGIGPGFRRRASSIRMGFWTPKLAGWTDKAGYKPEESLQYYSWISGVKVTGAVVNASPVICVVESEIADQDLYVEVTGHTGIPTGSVTTGGETITGFEVNHQYGIDIYRRSWCAGGDGYTGGFVIKANELPGKIELLPNKRIYAITDVNVYISGTTTTARRPSQPLTDLGFYALADNGSKLLYTLNWSKAYEDLRQLTFGKFAAPKKCPTCLGSGTIDDITCLQCDGYKYSGYNATGYMLDQMGKEYDVSQESGESFDVYQNRLWAKKWQIYPSRTEIQRYFAHFARIEQEEVEVTNTFRTASSSGIESVVNLYLPYVIPNAKFSRSSTYWNVMAKRCEPAGTLIRFSFLVAGGSLTGTLGLEQHGSAQMDFYSGGTAVTGVSGNLTDSYRTGVYGFVEAHFPVEPSSQGSWYNQWGMRYQWLGLTMSGGFLLGGNAGGGYESGDDCCSGYMTISGATRTWASGAFTGTQWLKWAWPSGGNGSSAPVWHTGTTAEEGYSQALLWSSGTYYWDNFWASGGGGIQY